MAPAGYGTVEGEDAEFGGEARGRVRYAALLERVCHGRDGPGVFKSGARCCNSAFSAMAAGGRGPNARRPGVKPSRRDRAPTRRHLTHLASGRGADD